MYSGCGSLPFSRRKMGEERGFPVEGALMEKVGRFSSSMLGGLAAVAALGRFGHGEG